MARSPTDPARPEGSTGTPPRESLPSTEVGPRHWLRIGWLVGAIVAILAAFLALRWL